MSARSAAAVARRCLCLEVLAQRALAEDDKDDAWRTAWLARVSDLGIAAELAADERAFLERRAGALGEDDRDDLEGRVAGAAVLLWALGRADTKPTFATAEEIIGEHGLLGDGSVTKARAAAEAATLRAQPDLEGALATYGRQRGKAKEPDDPEQIYAGIAEHHLAWILDDELDFST